MSGNIDRSQDLTRLNVAQYYISKPLLYGTDKLQGRDYMSKVMDNLAHKVQITFNQISHWFSNFQWINDNRVKEGIENKITYIKGFVEKIKGTDEKELYVDMRNQIIEMKQICELLKNVNEESGPLQIQLDSLNSILEAKINAKAVEVLQQPVDNTSEQLITELKQQIEEKEIELSQLNRNKSGNIEIIIKKEQELESLNSKILELETNLTEFKTKFDVQETALAKSKTDYDRKKEKLSKLKIEHKEKVSLLTSMEEEKTRHAEKTLSEKEGLAKQIIFLEGKVKEAEFNFKEAEKSLLKFSTLQKEFDEQQIKIAELNQRIADSKTEKTYESMPEISTKSKSKKIEIPKIIKSSHKPIDIEKERRAEEKAYIKDLGLQISNLIGSLDLKTAEANIPLYSSVFSKVLGGGASEIYKKLNALSKSFRTDAVNYTLSKFKSEVEETKSLINQLTEMDVAHVSKGLDEISKSIEEKEKVLQERIEEEITRPVKNLGKEVRELISLAINSSGFGADEDQLKILKDIRDSKQGFVANNPEDFSEALYNAKKAVGIVLKEYKSISSWRDRWSGKATQKLEVKAQLDKVNKLIDSMQKGKPAKLRSDFKIPIQGMERYIAVAKETSEVMNILRLRAAKGISKLIDEVYSEKSTQGVLGKLSDYWYKPEAYKKLKDYQKNVNELAKGYTEDKFGKQLDKSIKSYQEELKKPVIEKRGKIKPDVAEQRHTQLAESLNEIENLYEKFQIDIGDSADYFKQLLNEVEKQISIEYHLIRGEVNIPKLIVKEITDIWDEIDKMSQIDQSHPTVVHVEKVKKVKQDVFGILQSIVSDYKKLGYEQTFNLNKSKDGKTLLEIVSELESKKELNSTEYKKLILDAISLITDSFKATKTRMPKELLNKIEDLSGKLYRI